MLAKKSPSSAEGPSVALYSQKIHIDPCEQGVSVNPCEQGVSVNPCEQGVSVNPCEQGVSVNPCEQGVSVNPCEQGVSVNPCEQGVSVNPCEQGVSVNPCEQGVSVNPCEQGVSVNLEFLRIITLIFFYTAAENECSSDNCHCYSVGKCQPCSSFEIVSLICVLIGLEKGYCVLTKN